MQPATHLLSGSKTVVLEVGILQNLHPPYLWPPLMPTTQGLSPTSFQTLNLTQHATHIVALLTST